MRYEIQTWDEEHQCVRYHSIEDASGHDNARDIVKDLHPEQKVICVTKHEQL
mgnify:CR=1 FL=1|jgi:hypothetical protein